MEQILHTVFNLGIEKPFKILHITDVHLTEANEQDTPEHHELMEIRRETFHKEGSCPPCTPRNTLQKPSVWQKSLAHYWCAPAMPLISTPTATLRSFTGSPTAMT